MAKARAKKTAKVTRDDVNLLLRMAELYNTEYDFQATEWFWGEFKEKTIEDFTGKYPHGSRGYQFFERFTSKFELAGLLVENGILNEGLFFDRYGSLQAEWEKSKPIIHGLRKSWDEPRHRENFELLAARGRQWSSTHPPKIGKRLE